MVSRSFNRILCDEEKAGVCASDDADADDEPFGAVATLVAVSAAGAALVAVTAIW